MEIEATVKDFFGPQSSIDIAIDIPADVNWICTTGMQAMMQNNPLHGERSANCYRLILYIFGNQMLARLRVTFIRGSIEWNVRGDGRKCER